MTAETIQALRRHYGLDPGQGASDPRPARVGIEVEFPVLHHRQDKPDEQVLRRLIDWACDRLGLEPTAHDLRGNAICARWPNGDQLTFEFTYGALELVMAPSTSLVEVTARLWAHVQDLRDLLAPSQMTLGCCGAHPAAWAKDLPVVETPYYAAVAEFLTRYANPRGAEYARFNSYIASCQTHLDVDGQTLLDLLNTLNGISWARAMLFANAPFLPGAETDCGTYCLRDCLWDASAFAWDGRNTGGIGQPFASLDAVLEHEAQKSLFRVDRDGIPVIFEPRPMAEVLAGATLQGWAVQGPGDCRPVTIQGRPSDLRAHRSYNDIALTARRTLEVRGDCTQNPLALTAPAALYLGLSANLRQAKSYVAEHFTGKGCNKTLRREVLDARLSPFANRERRRVVQGLVDVARNGLFSRGQGEESLLIPLYERLIRGQNPAMDWIERVRAGHTSNSVAFSQTLSELAQDGPPGWERYRSPGAIRGRWDDRDLDCWGRP